MVVEDIGKFGASDLSRVLRQAIKDGMLKLRLEDDLGVRLSRTARERVEREFSWSRAQASLIEAYERLGVGQG